MSATTAAESPPFEKENLAGSAQSHPDPYIQKAIDIASRVPVEARGDYQFKVEGRQRDNHGNKIDDGDLEDDNAEHLYRPVSTVGFPAPARAEAFRGIAGEVTEILCNGTSLKPEAVLAQFLCIAGVAIGRKPYIRQEGDHRTLIDVIVVGNTSNGGKGGALGANRGFFKVATPEFYKEKWSKGHNSSETLIEEIGDHVTGFDEDGKEVVKVKGVSDKRLLVAEEEVSRVFSVSKRNGSIMSETFRELYDCPEDIRAQSRKSPVKCTAPFVGLLGHITPEGLKSSLKTEELFNGLGNRFTYIASQRTGPVPLPESADWLGNRHNKSIIDNFQKLLRSVWDGQGELRFFLSDDAKKRWEDIFGFWYWECDKKHGLHGAVIARWAPTIIRLALIYAVLDGQTSAINPEHLDAALALWEYSANSALWAFGLNCGDKDATKILEFLARRGTLGASTTLIRTECYSGGRVEKSLLDKTLAYLLNSGLVVYHKKGKGLTWYKKV